MQFGLSTRCNDRSKACDIDWNTLYKETLG